MKYTLDLYYYPSKAGGWGDWRFSFQFEGDTGHRGTGPVQSPPCYSETTSRGLAGSEFPSGILCSYLASALPDAVFRQVIASRRAGGIKAASLSGLPWRRHLFEQRPCPGRFTGQPRAVPVVHAGGCCDPWKVRGWRAEWEG